MTMGRLGAAPVAVRNAVYDAVHAHIRQQLQNWDSMWKGMVINQVESPTGRALLLEGCDVAIGAYEKAIKAHGEVAEPAKP